MEALGTPAHLFSPNLLHHLYLQDWKSVWPTAKLWGPASTIKKRTDLSFEAPLKYDPPDDWEGDIDQAWFRGSLFLHEVVFFHKPSCSAIFADLTQNFSEAFLKAHRSRWKRAIAWLWGSSSATATPRSRCG